LALIAIASYAEFGWFLKLKLSGSFPSHFRTSMLPVVIYETLISLFSFYREGHISQGMSYRRRLYKLMSTYTAEARLQAYTAGCELASQGNQVVITVSPEHYKVWIDLRAQPIAQPSESRSPELQPALAELNAAANLTNLNSLAAD
jgi:hypothetical protein